MKVKIFDFEDEQDLEKAFQIYQDCFQVKRKEHNLKITTPLLGLYQNENLIGICQINFINNIFENERIAYINSFGISPKEQHQGYGDYFLKEIIQYCKNNKATKINLTSNKNRKHAHKLYIKNNFNIIDTTFFNKNI